MLYARAITLRNCGRFTHISSDFGADYRTHTHVTSQALYASLTHETTRRRLRFVDLENDVYDFSADYDVNSMPVWFLPGIFVDKEGGQLAPERLDTSYFNVISSVYPSTSQSFSFKKGELKASKRSHRVPTFGSIQAVLPDNLLITVGFSPNESLLTAFVPDQIFLLGKKRTMFQITALSDVVKGEVREGQCTTGYLQLSPNSSTRFQSFEVLAATIRYVILQGTTREEVEYLEFPFLDGDLCLPDFYLEQTPVGDSSR
ncbi:MAG: hypothetical protein ISS50_01040 [Anaerolineae bacterium]|nr:hypothetical protein [Anaerolineae bacterium]